MTTLKCKMCGGNILVTGETHGICDSCGCEVTLPKIDDDRRAAMYDRGNHFRLMGNFDEAYSAYEHIIAENNQDAEAHWNLMLCRYGIIYERDVRKGEYIPTCSRLSAKSVLDDRDYLDAVKYADEYTKDIYRREARKIADIQKRFLEISRKEEPYDVFISFKHKDDITGETTKSSTVAQEIYTSLTKEGIRAFYSPESLLAHAGENYEPYIYAALNSAKLMILVGDSREHIEARWVKNEWMRYLTIMKKDAVKTLIPVCVDMSPGDLPNELPPTLEALEWGKMGVKQDIVTGVLKVTGMLNGKSVTAAKGIDIKTTISDIEEAMNDGAYSSAVTLANKILEEEPENSMAHYYVFIASNKVRDLEQLPVETDWSNDTRFKRARLYADEAHREKLDTFLENHTNERLYREAVKEYENVNMNRAYELFESIVPYRNSEQYCESIRQRRNKQKEYNEAVEMLDNEIGDGQTFMMRKMQQSHPGVVNKLTELLKTSEKTAWVEINWYTVILSLAMLVTAVIINITEQPGAIESIGWALALILYISYGTKRDWGWLIIILLTFVATSIPPIVCEFLNKNLLGVIPFDLLSLCPAAIIVRDIVVRIKAQAASRQIVKYYNDTVFPIEQGIIDEINGRYSHALGNTVYKDLCALEKPFRENFI